ncbi:MAG: sn-glycerol-1-phosphate dehydrogenase [Lachnospiraceae bacterium]|nr:sn-glycerol-1-phosphate dehydrogenase [Lachnospiraceae bacterium]
MADLDRLDLPTLIGQGGFQCSCGKFHPTGVRVVELGSRVLEKLPEVLEKLGAKKPMVVAGPFTYAAAGRAVLDILERAGIPYSLYVFEKNGPDKLQPDNKAVALLKDRTDSSCDLILAVGSGSLNDICKAAATELGLPQLTVGTAPSMDGYVSASASLELDHTKATVKTNAPLGVICDTDLMEKAPERLLWAGFGDIAAKVTALCEWKMVSLVFKEDYCETIAGLVRRSVDKTCEGAGKLMARDPDAVQTVGEGLLLSGLCMNFAGNSRPASGLEHYFSHCWEMMQLEKGEAYDLHGIYVGVGTLIELKLMKKLLRYKPTLARVEKAARSFDPVAWKNRLFRLFGSTAEGFLVLEEKTRKNDFSGRMERAQKIIAHWDELKALMRQALKEGKKLQPLMEKLGMPVKPADLGFGAETVRDAFIVSRDVRDKYLLSSLIWDLGLMDEFAAWLEREYS